jgi:hypothetical protein
MAAKYEPGLLAVVPTTPQSGLFRRSEYMPPLPAWMTASVVSVLRDLVYTNKTVVGGARPSGNKRNAAEIGG